MSDVPNPEELLTNIAPKPPATGWMDTPAGRVCRPSLPKAVELF